MTRKFSIEHNVKLNPKKCKEMLTNWPTIGNNTVEHVTTYKLLGIISNDFKWSEHIHYISHKALKCLYSLKCQWNENLFVFIWKAFQNTEEWRFSFWNIFFRFRDNDIFLLCKLDLIQWWCHSVCNKWKILNKRYLWKFWSSVLETWQHNCASQKKRNHTLSSVAIATISAPVSLTKN